MLRVVSVESFEVKGGASLRVIGKYPLLVLSWSTILIDGTIDVSTHRIGFDVGAGANRACRTAQYGEAPLGSSKGGGGGGGGFRTSGGRGGDGNGGIAGYAGGAGGGVISRPKFYIIGGCLGGYGSNGSGLPGIGGGAIQLTTRTSITISTTGKVLANGGGGPDTQIELGGGGGGAGGMIGLDAPIVTMMAGSVLAANGGGGAAGCSSGNGAGGQDGQPDDIVALGGASSSCTNGAAGGSGSARVAMIATNGATGVGGGGGGGGGSGYIIVWAPSDGFSKMGVQTPPEDHILVIESAHK